MTDLEQDRLSLAESIKLKRTRAEEIRDQAISNHQMFVRLTSERRQLNTRKPGIVETKKRWSERVGKARNRLQELGDPQEGSVQWIEKQRLLSTIDDGPL